MATVSTALHPVGDEPLRRYRLPRLSYRTDMMQIPVYSPSPPVGHNSGDSGATFDAIADALATKGWCVLSDYFTPVMLEALHQRLMQLEASDALSPAGIGRGSDNLENPDIRRDQTLWLETQDAAEATFLNEMRVLREALNRRLMLGLFFYEAHFARYNSGAFYKRHLDSFRGRRNRIISTVLYLNKDWQDADGGLLALYDHDAAQTPFIAIAPQWGTFALFLSEEMPHEVLPAQRPRASIAGWFRCNDKITTPALQAPTPASPAPA
jgi:SM-20-related protein